MGNGHLAKAMNEEISLLGETARRVFSACGEGDVGECHAQLAEGGLTAVMADAGRGGFGGSWCHAFPILFAAGEHAICYPISEAVLAASLLSAAGIAMPPGVVSLAPRADGTATPCGENHLTFSGRLSNVAFGAEAGAIVTLIKLDGEAHVACLLREGACRIEKERSSIAGEPRADLVFEGARVAAVKTGWTTENLLRAMALARACQIAGAISAALALSVEHTRAREQFGRPLAGFQAIQQQLAVLAEEASAARAAAAAACRAADRGEASFEIAAAKMRANQAAGVAASIAHQVHGAIGFTREYALQKFTRRLWAWRSDYGNERKWAMDIGLRAARAGADGFWPALVSGFAGPAT